MSYGLPTGSQIFYGNQGFPDWVYELAQAFGLKASTYPGHQENSRAEAGFAPNPRRLNRGIDWVGTPDAMDRFATYLLSIRGHLEQVIWEHPQTRRRVGVAGGDDVTHTGYYAPDYAGHRDHVHTRQSKRLPLPGLSSIKVPAATGWTGDPLWLADVLHAATPKLKVRELDGWQQSGHGDYRSIWGVLIHHTGNARESAESIRRGRPDLPGPLSNLHISPSGVVTVVAAGVCWHAGAGEYPGLPNNNGNWHLIGIECAWPMDTTITPATAGREPWPDAQMDAMIGSVAAILSRLGFDASRVISHKEWGGRAQGKWDPGGVSMRTLRARVTEAMRGNYLPSATAETITTGAEDMAQVPQEQWDRLYRELTQRNSSRSIYRTPGEGAIDTTTGMVLNVDAMAHAELVERLARLGDRDAVMRVARTAAGQGAVKDRQAISQAQTVLAEIERTNPSILEQFLTKEG